MDVAREQNLSERFDHLVAWMRLFAECVTYNRHERLVSHSIRAFRTTVLLS